MPEGSEGADATITIILGWSCTIQKAPDGTRRTADIMLLVLLREVHHTLI